MQGGRQGSRTSENHREDRAQTALKHLKSILKTTDAVMVARGDLGIEMPTSGGVAAEGDHS